MPIARESKGHCFGTGPGAPDGSTTIPALADSSNSYGLVPTYRQAQQADTAPVDLIPLHFAPPP